MKRTIYTIGLVFTILLTQAQTTTENYIRTRTFTKSDATTYIDQIQYFDGLGRPVQTVQRGIGPGTEKKDLVTYTEYDGVGRENIQWLPVPKAGNNGAYVDLAAFKTEAANLYGSSEKPYSTIVYEPSPLNRVVEQFGAGKEWYDNINPKRNTIAYEANISADAVAFFYVDNNGNLKREGNYAAGSLYKTVAKDEDGKTVDEYKDKLGQVVLKRSKNGTENVDTYFVNNDLGQLAYVIPPLAADGLTATGVIYDNNDLLKKYGYLYKYDERGNCKEKRLPGCEPIYMVYDRADRLVLSQDGNQRAKTTKEWTVTKYDILGRVIFSGVSIQLSGSSHADLMASNKSELIIETYANGAYTTSKFADATPLTINYYDNYDFRNNLPEPARTKLNFTTLSPYDGQHTSAKGLLTGTRTYYLDGSGNYSATALYYDYRGRVVQTRASNHLGGFDITYNQYNFSGQVTESLKEHNIAGQATIAELYTNTYDHAGRLLKTKYKLNQNPDVILNDMNEAGAYDEIGRLKRKKRHSTDNGTTFQDSEENDYNIRNWTERVKSGTFEEKLFYNSGLPTGVTACYNGNIAYSSWTYNGSRYAYTYKYDDLNRLIKADGYKVIGTSSLFNYGYNELFSYDKHGNILNLQRKKGTTFIDYINPGYNGNQMTFANDYYFSQNQPSVKEYHNFNTSGNDCSYDANGNMTKDLDRNIYTIRYNILNLPEIIQFKNGNQIRNTYDASGQKLSSRFKTLLNELVVPLSEGEICDIGETFDDFESVDYSGYDYVGNFEYLTYRFWDNVDGGFIYAYVCDKMHNSEGYSKFEWWPQASIQSIYFRRDHLGNNREVWNATTNTTIQRTQYYPSGLPWATISSDHPEAQNKKYNGKEFVEMHGLDEYDYHARGMYPAIMRFTTQDPLLEDYPEISPYAYCLNNPLRYNDPTGMSPNDSTNTVVLDDLVVLAKKVVATTLAYFYYANTLVGERVNRAFGYTNESSQSNFMTGLNTNMMILSVASSASKIKLEASSNNKNQSLKSLFKSGKKVKASELVKYAESQGWTMKRNPNGPIKYFDQNGVERLTIKKGSIRTPGSNYPHVAAKNASNVRIDPRTEVPVSRNSSGPIGNHTEIEYDL